MSIYPVVATIAAWSLKVAITLIGVTLAAIGQFHGLTLPMMIGAAIVVFGVSRSIHGERGIATWLMSSPQNTNSNT